jgi:triacylglycerol lipase
MTHSDDPHAPPPLSEVDAASAPTWRAAYADRTSALMATFSQLAYVPFEVDQPAPVARQPKAERPDGRQDLAQRLAGGGFQLAAVFNRDDTQAFLAVNPKQFAVLAFRGTTDLADWVTNLRAALAPLPGVPGIRVHAGFLSAFECCRREILEAVDTHVPPTLGLYITGHSLGGALAQIASAALDRDNLAACYTFGSPRVGAAGFDRQVKCPHYRVVNNWDLVPGVPTPWFTGYRHTGDPRLLTPNAHALEALRRDRNGLARFAVDVVDLIVGLVARRLLVIDDHMIWNYRTQLSAIAEVRAPVPAPAVVPPAPPAAPPTAPVAARTPTPAA